MPRTYELTNAILCRVLNHGELCLPYLTDVNVDTDLEDTERRAVVIKLNPKWRVKAVDNFILLWHPNTEEMEDLKRYILELKDTMDAPEFLLGYRWVDRRGKSYKVLDLKIKN